jgi:hypothetical protein
VAVEAPAAAMGLGSEAVEDSSQEAVEEEGDSTLPATTNGQRHDSIMYCIFFSKKKKL